VDLSDTVTNSQIVDEQSVDRFKDDFKPILSMSAVINGPGHRWGAQVIADKIFASLEEVFAARRARPAEAPSTMS
jgi:hypothetical protein